MKSALELFRYLKSGKKISNEEVLFLKDELNKECPDDLHNLANAFCLQFPPTDENIKLIARFLTDETDDWDLQGVISGLCIHWELTEFFLEKILLVIRLECWEEFSSSAIVSFSAISNYLVKNKNVAVMKILLGLLKDGYEKYQSNSCEVPEIYLEQLYKALYVGFYGLDRRGDLVGLKINSENLNSLIGELSKGYK